MSNRRENVPTQDEAVLAERYLDGTIDALDLLLCEDSCRSDVLAEHQEQLTTGPCSKTARASTIISRPADRAASSAEPGQETQTGANHTCGIRAGIPRRNADQLTYDEFVLHYMEPNLPVMIEVGFIQAYPFLCHASRGAFTS